MALGLSAEQKDLLSIFTVQQQYVIPSYQRAYSWEYDECFQLYTDIMEAFHDKQDYFIGNLVIAKSNEDTEKLEVIDGQQRLTTLVLLFKVLHLFSPLSKLHECFTKKDIFTDEELPRIVSKVFEVSDEEEFETVLHYDKEEFENKLSLFKIEPKDESKTIRWNIKAFPNRFERNALFFYGWIQYYQDNNGDLNGFIKFLIQRTYLLPIELSGNTFDEARTKALKIFETLNNRGKNLEDADIFKGNLYEKAAKNHDIENFIDQWEDLRSRCDALKIKVDDIFRYYSHVIRGKESKTSAEVNLRDFFNKEKYSPFKTKNYLEILEDLMRIVEIVEHIDRTKREPTTLAKWLQLIEIYTNQYPKIAVVVYLFIHGFDQEEEFILFLQKIVRFAYYYGSTSTIKFYLFNTIRDICRQKPIDPFFRPDITPGHFNTMGLLNKGYALLAYYLSRDCALPSYSVDKILNPKDKKYLQKWDNEEVTWALGALGNLVILDMDKKDLTIDKKARYYQRSEHPDIHQLGEMMESLQYTDLLKRDQELKETLVRFFKGEE